MTATVWKEMPMIPMVGAVMTKVLGTTSPPPPINPLSLAENSALDVPLAEAGLQLVGSRCEVNSVSATPRNLSARGEVTPSPCALKRDAQCTN